MSHIQCQCVWLVVLARGSSARASDEVHMFFVLLTCFALRTFWKDESWSAFSFVAGPDETWGHGLAPKGGPETVEILRVIGSMFLIFGEYLTWNRKTSDWNPIKRANWWWPLPTLRRRRNRSSWPSRSILKRGSRNGRFLGVFMEDVRLAHSIILCGLAIRTHVYIYNIYYTCL